MVEELEEGLRRVRAGNASPMTFTGTNSYILGRGTTVVIDPGPEDPVHLLALLEALGPHEGVAAILVTHAHRDHSGLAPALSEATGAPVLAFGDATAGRSERMQRLAEAGLAGGGEGVDALFRPDRLVVDGELLAWGGLRLTALHTPGHMGNHLSFLWGDRAFTGDVAMGWASTLISPPDGDLAAFMASMEALQAAGPRVLYPGHGEPAGPERLAWLTDHRRARTAALLAALDETPRTVAELTATLYTDTPPELLPAAERNVFAHLVDLVERNEALFWPELAPTAQFMRG